MDSPLADLRDACALVAKRLDAASVRALADVLPCVSLSALQQLAEYVLFPLRVVAKHPRASEADIAAALEGLQTLFTLAALNDPALVRTHVSFLALFLDAKVAHLVPVPEELLERALLALGALLTCSRPDALQPLYEDASLSILGHCLFAVVECASSASSEPPQETQQQLQQTQQVQQEGHNLGEDAPLRLPTLPAIERSRTLQLAAIETLTLLVQSAPRDGACLAPFLPGVASGLARAAVRDRQGQGVVAAAHVCFSELVSVVMCNRNMPQSTHVEDPLQALRNLAEIARQAGDAALDSADMGQALLAGRGGKMPGPSGKSRAHTAASGPNGQSLKVEQDEGWWRETAAHLRDFIKQMCQISVGHDSWRVRIALLTCARRVLRECSQSLVGSLPLYLDVVVSLADDPYENVRDFAAATLDELSSALLPGTDAQQATGAVTSLLESNFRELVSSLPRVMRQGLDSTKLRTLRLVVGYVRLLGPSLKQTLLSDHHLRRLSLALVQTLEFDDTDIMLIVEQSSGTPLSLDEDGSSATYGTPLVITAPPFRKQFKHFRDDRILTTMVKLCRYLGFFGNLSALSSHFFGLYSDSDEHAKEALFVLNELLLGALGVIKELPSEKFTQLQDGAQPRPATVSLARRLMDEFLTLSELNLVTSNAASFLETEVKGEKLALTNYSVSQLHHNSIISALSLESLASVARVLGNDFNLCLLDALYPLLSKLGSSTAVVSQSALFVLCEIAASCGYASPSDVISKNGDYLVNTIARNINYLSMHPETPLVFNMMLRFADAAFVPWAKDLARDVFDALDGYNDEYLSDFLGMLHSIVAAVSRFLPDLPKFIPKALPLPESTPSETEAEVGPEIEQDSSPPTFPLGEQDEQDEQEGERFSVPPEEPEPPTPLHQELVLSVLERCVHFLGCSSPRARLLVLETIERGVLVLKGNERKLLPIAHKTWQPIINRLVDSEPVVCAAAVRILPTLSTACGSFLRDRMLKQAVPLMADLLIQNRSLPQERKSKSYRFSMAFKTQSAVLWTLSKLCIPLEMNGTDIPKIIRSCLPYLHISYPSELRVTAVQVFKSLVEIDCDAVWFAMAQVSAPKLVPPNPTFASAHFAQPDPGFADSANELFAAVESWDRRD